MEFTNQFFVSDLVPIDISDKIGHFEGLYSDSISEATKYKKNKEKALCFTTNYDIDPNYIFNTKFNNKFIGTYYECFIHHGNAVFSPSDIWLVICLNFSKYINLSSNEELLKKYICYPNDNENEKKTLLIERLDDLSFNYIDDSINKIKMNTYDKNLIEILECDFESSNFVEKIACSISVMEATQKIFTHQYAKYCGFNAIKLLGEIKDWIKLDDKINKLKDYGYDNWKKYLSKINNIIHKFIDSFDKPDIKFFSKMIHSWAEFDGSIYDYKYNKISGWIMDLFFEFNDNYFIEEVPNIYSETNAIFFDYLSQNEYNISIKTGFYGIYVSSPNSKYNKTTKKYIDPEYPKYPSEFYYNDQYEYYQENDNISDNDNIFDNDNISNNNDENNKKLESEITSIIYDYRPIIYCEIVKL